MRMNMTVNQVYFTRIQVVRHTKFPVADFQRGNAAAVLTTRRYYSRLVQAICKTNKQRGRSHD